jgi:hypothetical protein
VNARSAAALASSASDGREAATSSRFVVAAVTARTAGTAEAAPALRYRRQKPRESSTSTGTISRRPKYISAVRTSLDSSLKGA